ncbi:MAG: dTDP-4-amino-4,6-dideoxygalactose transaminase [Deltaproteobacteria bacterium]|nr:dTDP-4-amino-4,6-dideoxygalactose transaminase [Deltaproteobacteria bacterium]
MLQQIPSTQVKPKIAFNRPFIVGKELFYIAQAVLGGNLAGDGKFTKLCNGWMERKFGAKKVLLTTSCTTALEICAILADIQPGDEVIMPSYTFVSTANAFALRGARIRFVDIRPDTLNIDENLIEAKITKKTKAIVPIHYAGVACELDKIIEIANKYNLLVIEDAAQGVNATYKGRYLGTIGHLGAYSFHETKNFISGEGGALVINDDRFIERAEIIREKGTDRSKFFRGEVDKYTWVDIGSSYLPSEIIAAFLYAQLEEADVITRKRWAIFNYYVKQFTPLQDRGLLSIPSWPMECRHNAHMFYLILPDGVARDNLMSYLKQEGIHAVFHYIPLHTSPMGLKMGYKKGDLPVTEDLSARLMRIPCFFELKQEDQDRIFEAVTTFFATKGKRLSPREKIRTTKVGLAAIQ